MYKIQQEKNRIFLRTDRLNWASTMDIREALYQQVIMLGNSSIILDLSHAKRVYPNGVVPIITELDRFRKKGVTFTILPPRDPDTKQYSERLDWLHFLNPDQFEPFNQNKYQNFALHTFDNSDQLNEVINSALEVCIKQLVFAAGSPQAFEWTINELAGNILVHAGVSTGYLQVLADREHHKLVLIVCDNGVGIPFHIKRAFPEYHIDRYALEHAIKKGVTSNPRYGQGNGLAGSVAIALASNSTLNITSSKGKVRVADGRIRSERNYPSFYGTCVELQFNTQTPIDLPKALWGHTPVSYFELKYENDQGDLTFKLTDHSSNFGNRPTGERIRTLVMNLLIQNPGKSVVIEMEDVGIVASSFADELFGKIASELGVIDFSRFVKLSHVNVICKKIINEAIVQRIVQSYGSQNVTLVDDIES